MLLRLLCEREFSCSQSLQGGPLLFLFIGCAIYVHIDLLDFCPSRSRAKSLSVMLLHLSFDILKLQVQVWYKFMFICMRHSVFFLLALKKQTHNALVHLPSLVCGIQPQANFPTGDINL